MHHEAIELLKLELESVQTNCIYLSQGIDKMLKRNISPHHGRIREAVILRWKSKLRAQGEKAKSLSNSIKVLEELDRNVK